MIKTLLFWLFVGAAGCTIVVYVVRKIKNIKEKEEKNAIKKGIINILSKKK